jgi:hypothetical protein
MRFPCDEPSLKLFERKDEDNALKKARRQKIEGHSEWIILKMPNVRLDQSVASG